MKAKVGNDVVVTKQLNGHKFKIGEYVEVVKVKEKTGAYKCLNKDDEYWWLSEDEFALL